MFATIGHSNRPRDVVIGMLQDAGIRLLVDVRSYPRSRSNPDFNGDTFPAHLADHQIGYRHMLALGGRRPRQSGVDPATNALWRVQSFHNYADHALGAGFQTALDELIGLGQDLPLAIMCSEAVWWRCHRRIITDYLLMRGHPVRHLMAPGRSEAARPTPGAHLRADGAIVYPQR